MSREFISQEIAKIFKEYDEDYPKNLAMSFAWLLAHFKATGLNVYNVSGQSSLADYYVIGSVSNMTLAQSVAEELERQGKVLGYSTKSVEGKQEGMWVLLDFGDVIVHIFEETARDNYNIDELWSSALQETIPKEYYYGAGPAAKDSDDGGYF